MNKGLIDTKCGLKNCKTIFLFNKRRLVLIGIQICRYIGLGSEQVQTCCDISINTIKQSIYRPSLPSMKDKYAELTQLLLRIIRRTYLDFTNFLRF